MDPSHFYGKNKYTCTIPEDGMVSEDYELDSEDENSQFTLPFRRPLFVPETDDESSEEDNVPLARLVKNKKGAGRCRKAPPPQKQHWATDNIAPYSPDNFMFLGEIDLPPNIQELDTPAEYFKFLFTDDLISMIADRTVKPEIYTR